MVYHLYPENIREVVQDHDLFLHYRQLNLIFIFIRTGKIERRLIKLKRSVIETRVRKYSTNIFRTHRRPSGILGRGTSVRHCHVTKSFAPGPRRRGRGPLDNLYVYEPGWGLDDFLFRTPTSGRKTKWFERSIKTTYNFLLLVRSPPFSGPNSNLPDPQKPGLCKTRTTNT